MCDTNSGSTTTGCPDGASDPCWPSMLPPLQHMRRPSRPARLGAGALQQASRSAWPGRPALCELTHPRTHPARALPAAPRPGQRRAREKAWRAEERGTWGAEPVQPCRRGSGWPTQYEQCGRPSRRGSAVPAQGVLVYSWRQAGYAGSQADWQERGAGAAGRVHETSLTLLRPTAGLKR